MKAIPFKQRSSVLACLGTLALLSTSAMAAPVTTWTYLTEATFTNAAFVSGADGSGGVTYWNGNQISWGTSGGTNPNTAFTNPDSGRSALTIGSGDTDVSRYDGEGVAGEINTTLGPTPDFGLGQIKPGISLTHWNNIIFSNQSRLGRGVLRDTLRLTPAVPLVGSPYDLPALTFTLFFNETPNNGGQGGPGLCADGTLFSSYVGGCPDLFGFDGTATLDQPFAYDGDDYLASIFILGPQGSPTPIGTLTNGECAVLNLGNGCQGFRTLEQTQTTATFYFAITTKPITFVPEPGTLALLGLGLAGLGLAARRKKI